MSNDQGRFALLCANWPPLVRLFVAIIVIYVFTVIIAVTIPVDFLVAFGIVTTLMTTAAAVERYMARPRMA